MAEGEIPFITVFSRENGRGWGSEFRVREGTLNLELFFRPACRNVNLSRCEEVDCKAGVGVQGSELGRNLEH